MTPNERREARISIAGAFISALLFWIAFPPLHAWPLAYVAVALLFRTAGRASPFVAALSGWCFGFVLILVTTHWAYMGGVRNASTSYYIVAVFVASIEGFAPAGAMFVSSLFSKGHPLAWAGGGAAAWGLFEILRCTGTYGCPFAQFSASQVGTMLSLSVPVVGAFGATSIAVFLCVLLASAIANQKSTQMGILLTAIAVLLMPAPRDSHGGSAAFQALLVNSRSAATSRTDVETAFNGIDRIAARSHSQREVIIWPENAVMLSDPADFGYARERLASISEGRNASLLVGIADSTSLKRFDDAVFADPKGDVRTYTKRHLVPFAEFLPFGSLFTGLPYVSQVRSFDRGPGSVTLRVWNSSYSVSPLICYEAAFPEIARSSDHATAIVVMTDDSWFDGSTGPSQFRQLVQLRSLETGSSILLEGTTGDNGVISPLGTWHPAPRNEIIAAIRFWPPQATIYKRIGLSSVLGGLFSVLLIALVAELIRRGRVSLKQGEVPCITG